MNLAGLLVGEASGAEYVFMDWKRSEGTRVHVVALDGSQVRLAMIPVTTVC